MVETVLVYGCLSLLSSRCVAQDDVVMASYVVSQKGNKWSRTCYQYEARDKSNDLIHKIVYKKNLSRSMVVVASRPFGSAALTKHGPVHTCVEVLGFRREQVKARLIATG